ncbi:uncharacterized protein G2W53_028600 [Senna tora]|uniref:Uncharacterized protein n=1 Tax=Senna tora TaxID=362788 RepID=A0A834T3J7_9FABA|nr:uncharacterized protein G2W53_028600 [Senna tora]
MPAIFSILTRTINVTAQVFIDASNKLAANEVQQDWIALSKLSPAVGWNLEAFNEIPINENSQTSCGDTFHYEVGLPFFAPVDVVQKLVCNEDIVCNGAMLHKSILDEFVCDIGKGNGAEVLKRSMALRFWNEDDVGLIERSEQMASRNKRSGHCCDVISNNMSASQ